MPDGTLRWYDERTGEAEVARRGRLFRAEAAEVDSAARHPGARVHFDIARVDGVERAVEVRLRAGTRVSRRQRGFGNLEGAKSFDSKGPAPYAGSHPELRSALRHPVEVVRAWATAVSQGDVTGALALYAPDAVVHTDGADLAGRSALAGFLSDCPVLSSRRHARIEGDGSTVTAGWDRAGAGVPGLVVRSRISHLLLAEQWVSAPEAPEAWPQEEGEPPLEVSLTTRGRVAASAKDDALRALGRAAGARGEPVLFARLKLGFEPDPARPRPAVAEAALDLGGDLVRAHVTARTMPEAIDALERRLRDQLDHRAEHLEHRRRRGPTHEPGEWRHGDLPAQRPPRFYRPPETRQLVRHKTFAIDELTADEAVFDMEQLDYDFYLFREAATGLDAIVERLESGSYRITRLSPSTEGLGPTAVPVEVAEGPVPVLDLPEATARFDYSGDPYLFFADAETARGNVLYCRYDGHYGLVTPE